MEAGEGTFLHAWRSRVFISSKFSHCFWDRIPVPNLIDNASRDFPMELAGYCFFFLYKIG